jgi:hypothetical protein
MRSGDQSGGSSILIRQMRFALMGRVLACRCGRHHLKSASRPTDVRHLRCCKKHPRPPSVAFISHFANDS